MRDPPPQVSPSKRKVQISPFFQQKVTAQYVGLSKARKLSLAYDTEEHTDPQWVSRHWYYLYNICSLSSSFKQNHMFPLVIYLLSLSPLFS